MSRQMWNEAVLWATADGAAVYNTTTETAIFPATAIPANYMTDGRTIRIQASGRISTGGAAVNLFVIVRWGGVGGVLIAYTQHASFPANVAASCWNLIVNIQTRANGATGSLFAMGQFIASLSQTTSWAAAFGSGTWANPGPITCDLSAPKDLVLSCIWGTASASNLLQGHIFTLESLN